MLCLCFIPNAMFWCAIIMSVLVLHVIFVVFSCFWHDHIYYFDLIIVQYHVFTVLDQSKMYF